MKTTLRWLATTSAVLHGVAHASTILFAAGHSGASSQISAAAYRAQVTQDLSLPGSQSAIVPAFDGLSSHGTLGGSSNALAYSYTVTFDVAANQAGNWNIRVGGDFGKGAAVFLDGVAIGSRSTNMWWNQQYDPSPSQTQSFQLQNIAVTAGTHTLQVFGLEDCCDGVAQAQFSINNGPYTTFSNVDGLGAGQPRFAVPMDDMETIGHFTSWTNVNDTYPKLSGEVDDTARLQRALDDLSNPGDPGKPAVLYLPAGAYTISNTLNLHGSNKGRWGGVSIIGEHPAQTTITWNGPAGAPMLIENGGYNTRYSRITWDGNNTAGYGVAHWWNTGSGYLFGGSTEHTDEVFKNMNVGIMAGRRGAQYGNMDSEGQVRRVTFQNISGAGIDTGSFNALDWWVWDSHFVSCGRGVSNVLGLDDNGASYGAGGIHVYRSVFESSTIADFNIGNTSWFSMHNNISVGSRRFFQAEGIGENVGHAILQSNSILDATDNSAISNGNLGAVVMIDNQIRSPASVTSAQIPQVRMEDWTMGRDAVTIGNRFTVPTLVWFAPQNNPDNIHGADRWINDGDTQVTRDQISTPSLALPATPDWSQRHVYEVPANGTGADIQATINTAIAGGLANPIVHVPQGTYYVSQTIVVPARSRIQIAGDGLTSDLRWTAEPGGVVFEFQGPSYATLRDVHIVNWNNQKTMVPPWAVHVTNADQPGGRIYIQGSSPGQVSASALSMTSVALVANPGIGHEWNTDGMTLTNVSSLVSIGAGGLGRVVSTNSNLLLSDTWYEGKGEDLFRPTTSGNFTYMGGHVAPCDHNHPCDTSTPTTPAILLDNFAGNVSFLGLEFNLNGRFAATDTTSTAVGIQTGTETSSTNAMFLGMSSNRNGLFNRTQATGSGNIGLVEPMGPRTAGGSQQTPNQGLYTGPFVSSSLQQARSLKWDKEPYSPPTWTPPVCQAFNS